MTTGAGQIPAVLALRDGTMFEGVAFGATGVAGGEVVFNTGMTGYQEILTDPSYAGQIVTMTSTQIGNYGVNPEDVESERLALKGMVIKELSPAPSNWRARGDLDSYLKERGIVGIHGIDTRALVRLLREEGSMEGVIISGDSLLSHPDPVTLARKVPPIAGRDLVQEVTCAEPYRRSDREGGQSGDAAPELRGRPRFKVVAFDFGIKRNILRLLTQAGCEVTVVPASTDAGTALALEPEGIFLSNGPGDPAAVGYAIRAVRELLDDRLPIFGICLGHQILGLALGGKTYKLKFGHHGGNQPVKDLESGRVMITAQNHGFAVDIDSLAGSARLTHLNLNDQTVEGLAHQELPLFGVQYHPEASPGPHDASHLFTRFTEMMKRRA